MKFTGMSPAELQFIRLYVTTLRREYYLLRSVMDLMHPSGLGVKSFTDAANMAVELDEMQKDFEAKLSRIQKKDNLKKINIPVGPTMNELADMFSLSFFKLITVEETPTTGEKIKTDDGWFSGKPTEWKKTIQLYKNTPKEFGFSFPDLLSNFFNTLIKFFPFEQNYKTWHEGPFGPTKKLWPPLDEYAEADEQYFEDDEDEDNGMSQFDMFFDDDE